MIVYENKKFRSLLILDGSEVFRAWQESILPVCITLILELTEYYQYHKWTPGSLTDAQDSFVGGVTQYKNADGTFFYTFFIFAFTVVVRTTMSYGRYQDGCNYLVEALTKWMTAYVGVMSLLHASEEIQDQTQELKDQHLAFRTRMFRNWTLLGACAIGQVSGETEECTPEENIAAEMLRLQYVLSPECKRRD